MRRVKFTLSFQCIVGMVKRHLSSLKHVLYLCLLEATTGAGLAFHSHLNNHSGTFHVTVQDKR